MRVFQLVHPDLPGDFPPLQSLDSFRGNLTVQATSFVGRERELAAIGTALESARLVSITGVGGVGKTRLAFQVAAEILPRFGDGAWACELAPATDDETLHQIVAVNLGVPPRAGVAISNGVAEFLRTKQLLLVLDNCEQLLDATGRFVTMLLRHCPGVRILATSREGLGVDGEQVWPLRSLSVGTASAGIEDLMAHGATRLFVERASAVKPTFALEAGNIAAVAEICQRLDGIPLAIELAAARVAAMNPVDIARRLDERFRLLTGGRRTAVERHQTLRAAVDWSYSLLAPREQRVFARLGVFAGTFDADAVQAVVVDDDLDEWDALDALADLVAKSMVNTDEGTTGSTRYQMLETLRQYARERLDEEGDVDRWRRRHAEHYAALAVDIGAGIDGPDEIAWHERLREEGDNYRAVVAWGLDAPDDADAALMMEAIAAVTRDAGTGDRISGIGSWAARALPRLDAAPARARAGVLAAAAWHAYGGADYASMRSFAEEAVALDPPDDSLSPPAAPFVALAAALSMLGETDAADECFARGLDLALRTGDDISRIHLLAAAAGNAAQHGDVDTHRAAADRALEEARMVAHPSALGGARLGFGWAHYRDDPTAALRELEDDGIPRNWMVRGLSHSLAARLRAERGESARALELLEEVIEWSGERGDRPTLYTALGRAVHVFVAIDEPATATLVRGSLRGTRGRVAMTSVAEREDRSRVGVTLRAQLGDDAYEAAAARGAAMDDEQLVDFLLAEIRRLRRELTP